MLMKLCAPTRYIVLSLFAQVVLLARMPANAQQFEEREPSRFQNGTAVVRQKASSVTPKDLVAQDLFAPQ